VLLEFSEVPRAHLLKAELLLEHGVHVEDRGRGGVLDVNHVTSFSCHDDRADASALALETVDLLLGAGESGEDELVVTALARPDDRLDKLHVHVKSEFSASGAGRK